MGDTTIKKGKLKMETVISKHFLFYFVETSKKMKLQRMF